MRNALDLWTLNPSFSPVFERLFEGFDGDRRKFEGALVLTPATDIEETPTHFSVSLDIPGVEKEAIQIEVVDDKLVVSAERKASKPVEGANRHLVERSFGKFHRVFTLGQAVQKEKIEATYRDGVLTLSLAKAEEVKPRLIQVQ
jgi:HSP20 family protein